MNISALTDGLSLRERLAITKYTESSASNKIIIYQGIMKLWNHGTDPTFYTIIEILKYDFIGKSKIKSLTPAENEDIPKSCALQYSSSNLIL